MVTIGDFAPNFTLESNNEKTIGLDSFSDKWIVLYFYPKDNTPGCTKEAIDFTEYAKQFKERNAVILGISPDSIESHKRFISKYNIGINLLSDNNKNVMKLYDAWGEKKNYGRVYQGVIRSTFIISPEKRIMESWKNVRVRQKRKDGEIKHTEIVLKRLKELQLENFPVC